jgi:hypothetical protein
VQVTKWNGKRITKAGWYSHVPIEVYHGPDICDGPAVSSSDLRTCWHKSPAHMYSKWAENPKREERTETRSMILGSAAHHLLLGEDGFKLKFVAQPELYRDKKTAEEKPWNNNATVCKDWKAKHEDAGRTVVTVKELRAIVEMARSLALEPLVKEGLLSGNIECSGFFKDKETGLWLKVRPDVVPMSGEFVDLKTAAEVTTAALMSSVRSYGYNQQASLIWEVCEALGQPFESFMLLFIETAAPFCARVVPMPDEDMGLGREQNRLAMRKVKACIDTGHWPGPGEGDMQALGLSKDERERIRTRLTAEAM